MASPQLPDDLPVEALQRMGELLPDGLVVVGADRLIRFVNGRALQILGMAGAELVGADLLRALPLADQTGRDWWDENNPWANTEADLGGEALVSAPGGPLLITTGVVKGDDGSVARVMLGLRDAADRVRAEADQATVLSTVAHELRAPLTSVTGFTGSLLRRWSLFTDAQRRFMIETIEADALRLTALITELLDISRFESGRLALRLAPVNLRSIVEHHVSRHQLSWSEGDVVLEVEDSLSGHEVWADADRLQQILFNVVENARTHGSAPVSIRLGTHTTDQGSFARIDVDDSGDGVPAELRAHVFLRFWHGEKSATTGLGLYLVKGLVEAHEGTISVAESPEGGARFRILLPLGAPEGHIG